MSVTSPGLSGRPDGSGSSRPGRGSFGGRSPCGAWLAGDREGASRPSDSGVLQRLGSKESRDQLPQRPPESWRLFPGAPAATSTALAVPAPAAATAAQGPRRNKTPRAEPPSRAVHEVAYLAGGSYVAAGLSVLAKARSRDRVLLRAYSFDAPPVLEALDAACARGAACSLVADASQCAKTKHQWQSLKRVATAGVSVRLAAGHSVRDAYLSDGRGATVGAGLKGLHHAKALLVVGETTAELIVGSLNWSTSSKANSECGLHLTVTSGAPVVVDFIRDFETVFAGASALDDAKPPAPKGAAASSSARHGPPALTLYLHACTKPGLG